MPAAPTAAPSMARPAAPYQTRKIRSAPANTHRWSGKEAASVDGFHFTGAAEGKISAQHLNASRRRA